MKFFFTSDIYENIGKNGYFTIAVSDDEDFVAGVLQFYVSESEDKKVTSSITYIFVDEEFRNNGAGTNLIWKLKDILSESGIPEVTAEVYSEGTQNLISLLEKEGFVFDSEVIYEAEVPEGMNLKKTSKNADKYLLYRLEVPEHLLEEAL